MECKQKIKVFVVCSGLGSIRRGFESFFRSCYDALCDEPDVDLYLYKGNGQTKRREIALCNIHRNRNAAIQLGGMVGRSGYFVEQLTFFVNLLPRLVVKRPDVIYVSDVVLANLLRIPRRICDYCILFNNNGPTHPEFLHRWNHIHQVSPEYLEAAVKAGVPMKKQTLLPSAVQIPSQFTLPDQIEKNKLRRSLKLPVGRTLLLSVGAINISRKRMDYLIQEVASLPEPMPFLLILGAMEAESEDLIKMGRRMLPGGFDARSVEKSQVAEYYQAADVFALASMDEGFGLVYVEALAHGLPCLVHDYPTARFVLGDMGIYECLSESGKLAKMISGLKPKDFASESSVARHAYAYEKFSWDRLKPDYLEMFRCCAGRGKIDGKK